MAKLAAAAGLEPGLAASLRTGEFLRSCSQEARSCPLTKLSSSEEGVFQKVLSALDYHHYSLFNKEMLIPSGISNSQSKR